MSNYQASLQSTNGSSPLHSSDLSIFSGNGGGVGGEGGGSTPPASTHSGGGPEHLEGFQRRGSKRGYQDSDDITEEIVHFIDSFYLKY